MTPVQDVLKIAVQSSWIQLAIDKYQAGGGKLSNDQLTTLQGMSLKELESLQNAEERIRAGVPGVAGDDGGIF